MKLNNPLRRSMLGATLALLTLLAACGGGGGSSDTDSTPTGSTPPPATANFTLALSAPKALILQGTSVTLDATVTRSAGFTGAVALAVTGLPTGVSASVVTIESGATTKQITLTADATAPHSLPTEASVKGSSGSASAQQAITVTVRGVAGALDTSFAASGRQITPVGVTDDYANAMVIQPDGRILVGGYSNGTSTDFALVRYLRDGGLDPSFGTAGKVTTAIGTSTDVANAIALQADGKILLAGSTVVEAKGKSFAVARYNADGSLDAGFGSGGKVVTSFGSQSDEAFAMVAQPDGKIVVGGHTKSVDRGVDFALARYNSDGSLDAGFGTGGKVVTAIVGLDGRDSVYALALQTIAGQTHIVAVGGEGDFVVTRYKPNGDVDPAFGIGARLDGFFGSIIGAARAVMVTPDNRIVIAGHTMHDHAVVQLTESGQRDPAFGGGTGFVITRVSSINWNEATAITQQADGKLVVAGWVYAGNGSSGDFVLMRLGSDGMLDAGFGNAGIVITAVAPGLKDDGARAVALQVDDRIPTVRSIVAGSANDANYDFALTRYWH